MRFAQRAKVALDVVSTLAVIIAASVLVWRLAFAASLSGRSEVVAAEDVKENIESSALTNVQGSGRLAIVEFSDFECPYCGEHARNGFPKLKRRLIDSGRARYIAMNFPLVGVHRQSMRAAEAAECAARQGRYWEMRAQLFSGPDEIAPGELEQDAGLLGLDASLFETCYQQRQTLTKVRADQSVGRRLGVRATPTIFVGVVGGDGNIELKKRFQGAAAPEAIESALASLSP